MEFAFQHAAEIQVGHALGGGLRLQGVALPTFNDVYKNSYAEGDLYQLAMELGDARTSSVDHAFRMRHASGKWVWLRARCELVQQPGESAADVEVVRILSDRVHVRYAGQTFAVRAVP